jgi:hypothetical protein
VDSALARLHLFELEDQPWFPSLIRDAGTAYLAFAARITRQAEALAPKLAEALDRSGEDRIVDLCSGGSGPLPGLIAQLDGLTDRPLRSVTLTDLYPNEEAFARLAASDSRIHVVDESVDATNMPDDLAGLWTLFSGFHHFRPEEARRILSNAVDRGASIAIFEVVARHPAALLGMFFAPLMTLVALPFLRPFRWGWLPLTYLVPVIPFFIFWDGFVSCLRCYSQAELRGLTAGIGATDYGWEIGTIDLSGAPFPGSYMIGTPVTRGEPPGPTSSS